MKPFPLSLDCQCSFSTGALTVSRTDSFLDETSGGDVSISNTDKFELLRKQDAREMVLHLLTSLS